MVDPKLIMIVIRQGRQAIPLGSYSPMATA